MRKSIYVEKFNVHKTWIVSERARARAFKTILSSAWNSEEATASETN